jgi:hypothetical protein
MQATTRSLLIWAGQAPELRYRSSPLQDTLLNLRSTFARSSVLNPSSHIDVHEACHER